MKHSAWRAVIKPEVLPARLDGTLWEPRGCGRKLTEGDA
jgi:hypothetical protein